MVTPNENLSYVTLLSAEATSVWRPQRNLTMLVLAGIVTISLLAKGLFLRGGNSLKLPPGPRAWPVIGNLHQMGGTIAHQALQTLATRYGPTMYMRLGSAPTVIISNAESARVFLKSNDKVFASRPPSVSGAIVTNNFTDLVWAPYGPYWRYLRKICVMELFSRKRLDASRPGRTEEINATVRAILLDAQEGKEVDLTLKVGNLTDNVITRLMLDKRYFGADKVGQQETGQQLKGLVLSLLRAQVGILIGDFIPFLQRVTRILGYDAHIWKVKNRADEILGEILNRKYAALGSKQGGDDHDPKDFVDTLLSTPSEDGLGFLPEATVKVLIVVLFNLSAADMIVAGTDTSSSAADWAIAELLRHPQVMMRLQAELDSVVGTSRRVEESDLPSLSYLQAVIKEVLRLHPPAPLSVPRESIEKCQVAGYQLQAPTRLLVNIYAIQRDPATWERPLEFDPERFITQPEIDVKGQHFKLLPFGAGRRQCPGISLGMLFVQICVARLIHSFNFRMPNQEDPKDQVDMSEQFLGGMLSRVNPLRVIAEPRLPSHLY